MLNEVIKSTKGSGFMIGHALKSIQRRITPSIYMPKVIQYNFKQK